MNRFYFIIFTFGVIPVMATSKATPTLANTSEKLPQEQKAATTGSQPDIHK